MLDGFIDSATVKPPALSSEVVEALGERRVSERVKEGWHGGSPKKLDQRDLRKA